jgi:hypothetical protein
MFAGFKLEGRQAEKAFSSLLNSEGREKEKTSTAKRAEHELTPDE